MNKARTTVSLLLAGLMSAGGAIAQSGTATSDVPVKSGEASTLTQGVPNMRTTNTPAAPGAGVTGGSGMPVDSATSTSTMGANPAPAGRVVPRSGATVTSNIPTQAGEASTMTNGVPNMSTNNAVVSDSRVVTPSPARIERVPSGAGEASTMVNGRMNGNPDDPMLRR